MEAGGSAEREIRVGEKGGVLKGKVRCEHRSVTCEVVELTMGGSGTEIIRWRSYLLTYLPMNR